MAVAGTCPPGRDTRPRLPRFASYFVLKTLSVQTEFYGNPSTKAEGAWLSRLPALELVRLHRGRLAAPLSFVRVVPVRTRARPTPERVHAQCQPPPFRHGPAYAANPGTLGNAGRRDTARLHQSAAEAPGRYCTSRTMTLYARPSRVCSRTKKHAKRKLAGLGNNR